MQSELQGWVRQQIAQKRKSSYPQELLKLAESGIRTHGRFNPSPVFKTGALNRSAISPIGSRSPGQRRILAREGHLPKTTLLLPFASGTVGPSPHPEPPWPISIWPTCAPACWTIPSWPLWPCTAPSPGTCRSAAGSWWSAIRWSRPRRLRWPTTPPRWAGTRSKSSCTAAARRWPWSGSSPAKLLPRPPCTGRWRAGPRRT